MFRKKKEKAEENIIQRIYQKDRWIRYFYLFVGVFMVAVAFNLFILPTKIVYGMNGVGVILNTVLDRKSVV